MDPQTTQILAEGIAAIVILILFLPFLRKDRIRRKEKEELESLPIEIDPTPEELGIEEQILEGQKRTIAAA